MTVTKHGDALKASVKPSPKRQPQPDLAKLLAEIRNQPRIKTELAQITAGVADLRRRMDAFSNRLAK